MPDATSSDELPLLLPGQINEVFAVEVLDEWRPCPPRSDDLRAYTNLVDSVYHGVSRKGINPPLPDACGDANVVEQQLRKTDAWSKGISNVVHIYIDVPANNYLTTIGTFPNIHAGETEKPFLQAAAIALIRATRERRDPKWGELQRLPKVPLPQRPLFGDQ